MGGRTIANWGSIAVPGLGISLRRIQSRSPSAIEAKDVIDGDRCDKDEEIAKGEQSIEYCIKDTGIGLDERSYDMQEDRFCSLRTRLM